MSDSPRAGRTDRGTSRVLGTTTLLAVTVVAALVAGTYAVGVDAPTAGPTTASLSLSYDDSGDRLVVHHGGGESLADGTLVVRNRTDVLARKSAERFGVGETRSVAVSRSALRDSEQIRLVWNPEGAADPRLLSAVEPGDIEGLDDSG